MEFRFITVLKRTLFQKEKRREKNKKLKVSLFKSEKLENGYLDSGKTVKTAKRYLHV